MQIDYLNMRKLIEIRMKQIYDIALEDDRYNREYIVLENIYNEVSELIKLERERG